MARPQTCGIYVITQVGTERCYVGQSIHCERRWQEHLRDLRGGRHSARYLQNAFNKYGEAAFAFNIARAVTTTEQLTATEQEWMDLLKPCFNAWAASPTRRGLPSPWKGRTPTAEARMKMSLAKKGKPNGRRGVFRHTEDAKERMSASKKGRPSVLKGRPSPFKGVPRTQEIRAAISEGHKRAYAAGGTSPIMSVSPEERSRRAKAAAAARWGARMEDK